MAVAIRWMPRRAPYMPVATLGLLSALDLGGIAARAWWAIDSAGGGLQVDCAEGVDEIARCLVEGAWPQLDRIDWSAGVHKQGLKPTLEQASDDHVGEFHRLLTSAAPPERALLRAIVTDGTLDNAASPSRSKLLRGVKADLSSIAARPKFSVDRIAAELHHGPEFRSGESGLGLGLVPEVQTFGATTGPDASTVGAYSTLLYLLLWRGIMAMTPYAVVRGRRRVVGSHLTTAPDTISWPVWTIPVDRRGLLALFTHPEVHERAPDMFQLQPVGVEAVYRARAVPLSTMVAVFRWGERVAAGDMNGADARHP